MRKSLLSIVPFSLKSLTKASMLFLMIFVYTTTSAQTPISSKAVKMAESIAVRDMAPAARTVGKGEISIADKEKNVKNSKIIKHIDPTAPGSFDAALHSTMTRMNSVVPLALNPPTVSFEGIGFPGGACNCAPPDVNGEVGLNHYVQTVNSAFRIWDKAGNPLTGVLNFSTLFGPLGACGLADDGDPIVLYDQLADRWLISEFCTIANPNTHQLIAISKTGDPTGAYWLYDFAMPNNKFNDYPHFGVWPDAYYMSDNQFTGGSFTGAGAFAFDRNKMLIGDPTASFIYFDLFASCPSCGGQLPTDLEGFTPPPAGMGNVFMEFRADEFVGNPIDGLRMFEFKPNFVTPASSTFTLLGADLPLAAFDARNPGGRSDIEQPGTAVGLDVIADRLMHRLAYRNLGSTASPTNSWLMNFSVNVSGVNPTTQATHQSGIRWTELRRVGAGGAFSVNQQGTQATNPGTPAGGTNLWMGSVTQNHSGDIVLGYSTSGSTDPADFPSIRMSGRLSTDPLGVMSQGEVVGILGTGFQNGAGNRWGDYSAMSVDPANDHSFWYTQEYRVAANNANAFAWSTRVVGGIDFSTGATTSPRGTISGIITNCASGLPIPGAVIQITGGYFRQTNASGAYSAITIPGTYTVTVSAPGGFGTVTVPGVVVTNGNNTVVSLCLAGTAILTAPPATIVAESCLPNNGVLDPNETVTVSLCVQNTGGGNTANLVGTLQATGGVVSPSGPQNYGIVLAGGAAVCRNFTFTASGACGTTVTATLQLQDGATNLGTVTYTFLMGLPGATITTSYSGPAVAIPDNLPAGVNIPLTVSGVVGTISDLNFRLDALAGCDATILNSNASVDHTFNGDLIFRLTSPGGTTVNLITNRGGGGNNFCTVLLDDDGGFPATSTMTTAGAVAGNFAPESPLSAFDGQNANGVWTLNVSDNAGIDVGSLRRYSLIITGLSCASCAPAPTVTINQAAAQPDPTTISPINFTATFSEAVSGFTDTDVTLGGTAGATTAVVTGGPIIYNVAVSGMTGSGTVTAAIPANVAINVATVGNLASTSTDNSVIYNSPFCTNTVSYTGPAVAIPDVTPAGVNILLPVSGLGLISDLDFRFDAAASGTCDATPGNTNAAMDHTFIGDLIFTLTSPAGTTVTIVNRRGGTRENICNTLLDDDGGFSALSTVTSTSGLTLSGNFTPDNPLSAFDGQNPNGNWTLNVSDNAAVDIGSLRRFSLLLTTACVPCVLTCPANITVNTAANQCGAVVTYPAPTTSGVCGTVTASPASGSFFPKGTTTVTATSTTGATCTFTITVVDNQAPTITCPANVTVSCAAAVPAVNIGAVVATDNCPGVVVTHVGDAITAQTCANRFTLTRTYRATDAAGLVSTCTQTITVNDVTAPTITACPAAVTVSCAAAVPAVNLALVTATDNCAGVVTITHIGDVITAQTCANRYTLTRTYRATDVCGNFTNCVQIITVNDITAPVVTCPANIAAVTPVGSCTAIVTFTPTATDNCAGAVTITSVPASGSAFIIGTTPVIVTATDVCGNSSTCSFLVTVTDGQLPTITAQPVNRTVCAGSSATFNVTAITTPNAGGPIAYQWEQWNGSAWVNVTAGTGATTAALTFANVSNLPQNTNTFRVKLTGLCTTVFSGAASLYINPLPTISIATSIPPNLLPGQSLNITATVNPAGGSFVWFRNNQVVPGVTGAVLSGLTVDNLGTYRAVYTDLNGCVSTSADVTLTGQPSNNLYVYPNPNTGVFQVRFYNVVNEAASVIIYDAKGARVFVQKFTTGTPYSSMNIDISRSPAGIYIVEVVNAAGKRIAAKRIVKQL